MCENTGRYEEHAAYDKNGNYKYIVRNGRFDNGTYDNVDVLVSQYNFLNLPRRITIQNGFITVEYVYDAMGTKFQTIYIELDVVDTRTYAANRIYGGTISIILRRLLTQEGYIDKSGDNYSHFYFLKDYLGSNRRVLNSSGGIVQSTNYYAFGSSYAENPKRSDQWLQPYKYNGKELDRMIGLDYYYYSARTYDPVTTRFTTMDPLSEKDYSISPYVFCMNNPVRNIDPFGMDVYRYDDKTGAFTLYQKNDDKFDQVGKFNTVTNKETGEKSYELKTNKDGTAKTRIDNVEKGILSDGINFMKNDNVIAVGGKGQASVGGVEAFAVNLSDMVGKEVSGAYFSKDGAEATTQISIGSYQNNTLTQSVSSGHALWQRMNPDSQLGNSITGFFHTHPTTGYSVSDRTRASDQDKRSRDAALKLLSNLQFYILTHPVSYGGTFPYKIPYKNAW